jgi:Flp pilus assembly pilin Flp
MNSRAQYAHQIHLPHLGMASSSRTEPRMREKRIELRTRETKGGESHMTYMNHVIASLYTRLNTREEGQTMAEYGVVLAVITITAAAAFLLLGQNINVAVDKVTALIKGGG